MRGFLPLLVAALLFYGASSRSISSYFDTTKIQVVVELSCNLGNETQHLFFTGYPENRPYEWCYTIELREIDSIDNPLIAYQTVSCTRERTETFILEGTQDGDGLYNNYYETRLDVESTCTQEYKDKKQAGEKGKFEEVTANLKLLPTEKERVSYKAALDLTNKKGDQGVIGDFADFYWTDATWPRFL